MNTPNVHAGRLERRVRQLQERRRNMKTIETKGGRGYKVILEVLGEKTPMPLSGVPAYPVRVLKADGPYYCTGWHIAA